MKKIHFFFLPALITGVASLLATGIASAQESIYVTNNGGNNPGGNTVEVITVSSGGTATYSTFGQTGPANLSQPTDVAFNSAGDLFVANNGSGNIAEFSPTGAFIGNYATGQANPRGLVFDSIGNLYVADQGSGEITEIPFGSAMGTTGTVVATGLGAANGMAMYNGVLYVADGNDNSIDTISSGSFTQIASVINPNSIVFDSAGNMFVISQSSPSPSVVEFSSKGAYIGTVFTDTTPGDSPKNIAMDSEGDFYVTDYTDHTVTEYNSSGVVVNTFSSSTDLYGPYGIAVTGDSSPSVPEPSAYVLLTASLALILFMARRKRVLVRSI